MSSHSTTLADPLGASLEGGRPVRLSVSWERVLPLLLPFALLLLWQLAAQQRWVSAQILPEPVRVYQTFVELLRTGEILDGLLISMRRIALGFSAGAGLGLLIGSALGVSTTLRVYLEPVLRALFAVPSIGWIPILILIFGIDEALKIIIVIKAVMVPVIINTMQGIRGIPAVYQEVADVLRLRPATRFLRLTVPAALPTIFGGIRLGLSNAFVALVVVEMLAATEGLGYMMVWGRTLFQLDIVMVGMVVIGVVGLVLDRSLSVIERHVLQWGGRHG